MNCGQLIKRGNQNELENENQCNVNFFVQFDPQSFFNSSTFSFSFFFFFGWEEYFKPCAKNTIKFNSQNSKDDISKNKTIKNKNPLKR